MTGRRGLTWTLLGGLLLVQVLLVLSQVGQRTSRAHDVPVGVQAPAVVAQTVVDRLNAEQGHPTRAVVLPNEVEPEVLVRDRRVDATLVADLAADGNVLHLSSVADPLLNRTLARLAQGASDPMGRTLATTHVPPLHHPEVVRGTLYRLSGLFVVLGFVLGFGVSALARARPSLRRTGTVVGLLLAAGVTVGLAVGALAAATGAAPLVAVAATGSLATSAAAVGTLALDRLLGLVGVAVAATLCVFFTAPLFSARDVRLLATPWRQVVPWTPHGATVDLLMTVTYGGSGGVRPTLVLAGVLLVGLVAVDTMPARPGAGESATAPAGDRHGRLQGLALGVLTAMAVVAGIVIAPAGAVVVPAVRVQGDRLTSCVPRPKISTVAEINRYIQKVRADPSFQGADVGADVRLQDGRRLWVFADTLRAPDFDGQKFVRNSMLVFDPACVRTVLPADHGALIPDRDGRTGYWPMSIARESRDGYDLVGVATQRVRATDAPDGIFAFETLGPSMAVFLVRPGGTPQFLGREDIGADDASTTRPMWGAAAAVDHGWAYLYGTARPDKKGAFGYSLRVARTRPDDLLHPATWQYWDGRRWQASAAKAKVLIPAHGGVSQTLSVFRRGATWYAVSKRDEVLGTDLVVWRAPSPTGPFDAGTIVGRLPSDPTSGELRYMPLAHPDLIPDKRSVMVSYSRNNTDAAKVRDDPFLYRPEFLRVTLP